MDQNPYESPREPSDRRRKPIDANTVAACIIGIGLMVLAMAMLALAAFQSGIGGWGVWE
jgi:hypothetical protein